MDAIEAAALVAPQVDRLRAGIAQRSRALLAPIVMPLGLPEPGTQILALMRNLPGRSVHRSAVKAAVRYLSDDAWYVGIGSLLEHGLVSRDVGMLELTDHGVDLARQFAAAGDQAARDQLGDSDDVRRALVLTRLALADLPRGADAAFSVVFPANLPTGTSDAGRLAENLTALRFHRADAHAAAWTAAGHTAESIAALAPGAERDAVEADTNVRAAEPYTHLDPEARAELVRILSELPD